MDQKSKEIGSRLRKESAERNNLRSETNVREKREREKQVEFEIAWSRILTAALHYSRANTPCKVAVLETRNGRYDVPIVKRWKAIINAAAGVARREWTSAVASFASLRIGKEKKEKRRKADKKKVSLTRPRIADIVGREPTTPTDWRRQVIGALRHLRVHWFIPLSTRGTDRNQRGIILWERPTVVRRTNEIYLTPSRMSDVRLSFFCERSVLDMLTLFAVMLTFSVPDCRQKGEAGRRLR